MPKRFSDDNKSVRVTGSEPFSFSEFQMRSAIGSPQMRADSVVQAAKPSPEEEARKKNRAKAKKAVKK